jgi:hypothetical protein
MRLRGHHGFIESATAAVGAAKELVLPLAMLESAEAPWTSATLRALRARLELDADPFLSDALALLEAFELPFLEEEERLAGAGLTLGDDLLGFEEAMLEFERAFWLRTYEVYRAEPERWNLPDPPTPADLCAEHGVDTATVRTALRDAGFTSFEEAAPYVGASPTCAGCRLGVTRLLSAELGRVKGGEAVST